MGNGLIPAHAGKTVGCVNACGSYGAHPRACGENREIAFGGWFEQGSSPRMRGKQNPGEVEKSYRRLIPAHAGKTSQCQGRQ